MKISPLLTCWLGVVCAAAAIAPALLAAAAPPPQPLTVPELGGLTLQPIPVGSFTMGSPADEAGRDPDEGPTTRVTLLQPFWLGQHEVTQGQWKAIMGADLTEQAKRMLADDTLYALAGKQQTLRDALGLKKDSDPKSRVGNLADDLPIYYVSWNEAAEFCRKLTVHERNAGRLLPDHEFRLPTEAEWEYACRAGTTGATYAGPMEIKGARNAPVLDPIAWYGGNSSVGYSGTGWSTAGWAEKQFPGGDAGPRTVGTRRPNAWGLGDMLGNVAEWCGDWYAPLPGGPVVEPRGPATGSFRVVRGGAWNFAARNVRAASRNRFEPGFRLGYVGFRVALAPLPP